VTKKTRRRPAARLARPPRKTARASSKRRRRAAEAPTAVTAAELRALRRELEQRLTRPRPRGRGAPMRWNPEPEDVQRSVAQLVLTLVEFLRRLMERQAIQRMERGTLTKAEIEAVGTALMQLEETIQDIGRRFGLAPEDLNLDLGPLGTLM
jgi:hypothetical protein